MPSTEEMVAILVARVDTIERERARSFDWGKVAQYLPAVRSLLWALGGVVGGGAIGGFALAPAPQVVTKEVPGPERVIEKHVPLTPGVVKSNKE